KPQAHHGGSRGDETSGRCAIADRAHRRRNPHCRDPPIGPRPCAGRGRGGGGRHCRTADGRTHRRRGCRPGRGAPGMEFFHEAETWVGIGSLVFFAILLWKKVPALVAKGLDARAAAIAKELADARGLREEAEALLAQYKRKQADAEKEASSIISEARAEAER